MRQNVPRLGLIVFVTLLILGLNAGARADDTTAIYGSGNGDTGWTTSSGDGVEIGLRAHVRYNSSDQPENTYNWDSNQTYNMAVGSPSFDPTRATWSFDFSGNTVNTASTSYIGDLTWEMGLDGDASEGTNFYTFDPFHVTYADHAFGDDTTANGGGTVAVDATEYASLLGSSTVGQNSWQYNFFGSALGGFDPSVDGTYNIYLAAYNADGSLATRTNIRVVVGQGGDPIAVPLPAAFPAGIGMLGLLGFIKRRRAKKLAA